MPRSTKHLRGEVKPSKFKTSLCQYFLKGESCPFGERCAFAHGDQELRSEQQNINDLFYSSTSGDSTRSSASAAAVSEGTPRSSGTNSPCETATPREPLTEQSPIVFRHNPYSATGRIATRLVSTVSQV